MLKVYKNFNIDKVLVSNLFLFLFLFLLLFDNVIYRKGQVPPGV